MSKTTGLLVHETAPSGPFDVSAIWSRIEASVQALAPALNKNLGPRGDATAIADFEKAIGRDLPGGVRESFLVHDGQLGEWEIPYFYNLEFMPLKRSLKQWKQWRHLDDETELQKDAVEMGSSFPPDAINLGYANPDWIPLVDIGGSNFYGIDLAPGPKGVRGQVINFGRDEEDKVVLAWSWGAFLNDLADEIERGNFRYRNDEYEEGLILIDPPPHNGSFFNITREWAEAKIGKRG